MTNFSYTWNANKDKLGEADGIVPPVNSQTFGYDNEDRLTSFNRQNGDSQSWTLSLVGDWNTFNANGTAQTRTHDATHELKTINGSALTYDLKGNLTQNTAGQGFVWDYENRMSSANSGATTLGAYKYDALGRRVSKVAGATTTVYVNDGLQEIAEYDNGVAVGSPSRTFVFGSYIDEPLMMVNGGVKTYYHTNNLYSVAALTNAAGAVVERYTYDPYGKVKILAPDGVTVRTASALGNPWYFTGRRLDSETGLMYYRARYYDVGLGRFIGRDPDGYRGGINLYEYVMDNPMSRLDPYGLGFEELINLAKQLIKDGAKDVAEKALKEGVRELEKGIASLGKQIVEHEGKLKNLEELGEKAIDCDCIKGDKEKYIEGLKKYWKKEIQKFKNEIAKKEGEIEKIKEAGSAAGMGWGGMLVGVLAPNSLEAAEKHQPTKAKFIAGGWDVAGTISLSPLILEESFNLLCWKPFGNKGESGGSGDSGSGNSGGQPPTSGSGERDLGGHSAFGGKPGGD